MHGAHKLRFPTSKMKGGLMARPLSTHEQVHDVCFGKTERFRSRKASIVPLPGASRSSFGKQACSTTAPSHSVYRSRSKRPSSASITSAHHVRCMGQTSSLGQNPAPFKRPTTAGAQKRRNVQGGYTTWSCGKSTAPSAALGSRQRFGDWTVSADSAAASNPGPGQYQLPSSFGQQQPSSRLRSASAYTAGGGRSTRPCNRKLAGRADGVRSRKTGLVYVYDSGYHDARHQDERLSHRPDYRKVTSSAGPCGAPMTTAHPSLSGRVRFGTLKPFHFEVPKGPPKKRPASDAASERVRLRNQASFALHMRRSISARLDRS